MNLPHTPIYPIEPWTITETEFNIDHNYRNETTFALSNGYIGTRGTFEEEYDFDINTGLEGNFINGFYESENIRYGEWNFGFPTQSQSLLNLPNAKIIILYLEDEIFDLRVGTVEEYSRVLHMKDGIVSRTVIWTSPKGKQIKLETTRLVSFLNKNLMEIKYSVTPLNFEGKITLVSKINGNVENHTRKTNPLVDYGPFGPRLEAIDGQANEDFLYYEGQTIGSKLSMACGCSHSLNADNVKITMETSSITFEMDGCINKQITLEKYIAYTSSLDMDSDKLKEFVVQELKRAKALGYQEVEDQQKAYMNEFWNHSDIGIQGEDDVQQGIRFNLFHTMQAAGRDGKTGMGAKGLTGEGYEGHYFWDTEMYVLPFLIYTNPEMARNLLDFRYHTLGQARERARVLGHSKGALYPWRTINGNEASTYYPLGTAQYHINADISYAFNLYFNVTGDKDYLIEKAAEVLCETARVWADVGCFVESKGNKYCICAVTGPDEYNAIVDNNFYTNLMARENIRDAIHALETMKQIDIDAYSQLIDKLQLEEAEIIFWQRIVDNMYFPYDEKLEIYPQDDGFMQRKPWDDSKIPPEKRHLLFENYHPLFIFRQRMSKQADAILGMYLHSNLFTKEELKRNYDFYQTVTLHHSSLSTSIFGIVACDIENYEEAYTYFSQAARMDLDDHHNNFYAGIHAANMAGTWQTIVNGFAGVRTNSGHLAFNPFIPKKWSAYTFKLLYRGSELQVEINQEQINFELKNGNPIPFNIKGKEVILSQKGDVHSEKI